MIDRSLPCKSAGNKSGAIISLCDAGSILGALLGAIGFFVLASVSLALARFDTPPAIVWLPNAVIVAVLLRARLTTEIPLVMSVFCAGLLANITFGNGWGHSAAFSLANIVEIAVVTWTMRRSCGPHPDITQLPDLARFIWAGCLIGPCLSTAIAAVAIWPDTATIRDGALTWFLTSSMGMALIAPTALLAIDALQSRIALSRNEIAERTALLSGGAACVYLVFLQEAYPLLFLIPPITLLHAFRLGSLGTALFVLALAIITSAMTWAGYGPISVAVSNPQDQLHLIQGFIAANLLTGLPITAILAGRDRIVQELDSRRRELALLTENATDALMHFDPGGRCIYASPSVANVLGEPANACLGKRLADHVHADSKDSLKAAQMRLLCGESDNERFTYRRRCDSAGGVPVYLEAECAIAFQPETTEREGMVVSVRDVTERVELELQLTRARRHAEDAARAKSQFLTNMSHEIRTPMNGVLGFAELMLQGELDDDQRRQIEMIVESGRSMILLLNDILDLSKIEAGQITIDQTPVDIAMTLCECADLHRPSAERKGLDLTVEREGRSADAAPHTATWIRTDGLRVRQIVLNLIGNAVKFTQKGSIRVRYTVNDGQLSVRITDTGIGIGAAKLDSIFAPFTQGESDTARRFGGTGLGLSISRQLSELLGGRIEVESEAGRGSSFTLTLPVEPAQPEKVASDEVAPLAIEDLPRHARILLAEDHEVNRMLASEMLDRCGQNVAVAHDGNEAISMVVDSMMRGSPYDLVLMDIQMPDCDGYVATRAIRDAGLGPETLPIIALTANAFPEDVAAARKAGMQAHLSKPLAFADLARTLQRWLPTRIIEAGLPE